jgi:glycosyltransferase involved in cell wall biosynthesis
MNELTVVVTRYKENDGLAMRCLESLVVQHCARVIVLFLDQQESETIRKYCKNNSHEFVTLKYMRIPAKSLSYARNEGIRKSKSKIIAFCDVDCKLESNWAAEILKTFQTFDVAIVGTKILPEWSKKPKWYHKSKFVLEFYSMLDLSNDYAQIDKVIGASFAINKNLLGEQAYFDEKLGRVNGKLLGGEETDLCSRAKKQGLLIEFTPHTWAHHLVEPERLKLSWLVRRAFYGGYSRGLRGGKTQSFNVNKQPIDYAALAILTIPYCIGKVKARYVTNR